MAHLSVESVTGTFANRLVHWESRQVFIGPHAIDPDGNVRTIEALKTHRLTATARHLRDPKAKVYFLTMEGALFEVDVATLAATKLADLNAELDLPKGAQPHYKGAFAAQGRLVVANNTYDEHEYLGTRHAGRLAEGDGEGAWTLLERNPFIEVSGKQNPRAGATYGYPLYAAGWGAVWRHTDVAAGEISDPFLMTGFDHKVLHPANETDAGLPVTIEVDFLGDGSWHVYERFRLAPTAYVHHEFPAAFSAHWVRLRADAAGRATAQLFYR